MKRILALILALAMMLGLTACGAGGGGGGNGKNVQMQITVSDYGFGTSWLRNAVTRFNEEYKDHVFSNGKEGVYAEVVLTEERPDATGGYDIYFLQNINLDEVVNDANILDLNDIVTADLYEDGTKSIEDKLYPEDRDRYKSLDGNYKTLPTHETYYAITYDRTLFEDMGFFILSPEYADMGIPWTFGKIADICSDVPFIEVPDEGWDDTLLQYLSVGRDGIRGTKDDGLPSSLMEFFTLCDYMRQMGVHPLSSAGANHSWYMHASIAAMMSSLFGEERLDKVFDFDTDLDVITSFWKDGTDASSPNPFYGLDYIEKPNYANVAVTEETGYYATWSSAKYWGQAFAEIMIKEGWMAPGAQLTGDVRLYDASQAAFINGGHQTINGLAEEVAMLSEGTWWYNESNKDSIGNLRNFNRLNPEVGEQDFRVMPLPTNIYTSVTGENENGTIAGLTESKKGQRGCLVPYETVFIVANKNVTDDPALFEAVNMFFEFFHSDEELQRATATAGFKKMFQYNMDNQETAQGWAKFYKETFEYTATDCYILRKTPNTDTGIKLFDHFYSRYDLINHMDGLSGGERVVEFCYNKPAQQCAYIFFENGAVQASTYKTKFYCGDKIEDVKDVTGVSYLPKGL